MSNALEALLAAKPVSEITAKVRIERLNTDFIIKALSTDDVQMLRDEATQMKNGKLEVNQEQLGFLMIAKATVDPDFSNKELMKHVDAKTPIQCVKKTLTTGEFNTLTQEVLKINGLQQPSMKEIEEVKNS